MPTVDDAARVVDSDVGRAEIREFATIHDAEIGEGAVVSAGATVTDDVGPQKVVRGSPPTRRIVPLTEWLGR